MKNAFAEKIILRDNYEQYFDESYGNIKLGISPDNEVYFSELYNEVDIHNHVLRLNDYHGLILVPPNAGIQITNTLKSVSGIIASPAYICMRGDINLKIAKDSGLELCITSDTDTIINGKHALFEGYDMIKSPVITRSFEDFVRRYKKLQGNAGLISQKSMLNIDTCLSYNLVFMEKDYGNISIQYAPGFSSIKDIELHECEIQGRVLQRDICNNTRKEEYEKAASKQKELEEVRSEIEKIYTDNIIERANFIIQKHPMNK